MSAAPANRPQAAPSALAAELLTASPHGDLAPLLTAPQGERVQSPSSAHCAAVGGLLGRLHLAMQGQVIGRPHPRGARWWRETSETVLPRLASDEAALLREELRFQGLYRFQDLPRGPIHGSPLRGEILFSGADVGGLRGMDRACDDVLLLDLAVAANDWCSNEDGTLDVDRLRALLAAYDAQRPLTAIERGAWPVLVRAAALSAWLEALEANGPVRDGLRRQVESRRQEERLLQLNWV